MRWALALAVAGGVVLTAGCNNGVVYSATPPGAGSDAEYQQQLFDLTNAARAERGLGALVWSDCLYDVAVPRAATASEAATLEHEQLASPCQDEGMTVENLARLDADATGMMAAWLDSPGHAQNIQRAELTQVGIACLYLADVSDEVTCSWLAQGPAE